MINPFNKHSSWVKFILVLAAGVYLGTLLISKNQSINPAGDSSFQYTASMAQQSLNAIKNSDSVAQNSADSDNDGLTDSEEAIFNSDPKNPDTDGDGFNDGAEVMSGFSPTIKGAAGAILAIPPDSAIKISDQSGKDAIASYLEQSKTPPILKSSSTIYQDAIKDAQNNDFKKIDQIISALKDSQAHLLSLSVPAEVKDIHKLTIAIMPALVDIFKEFKNIKAGAPTLNVILEKSQTLLPFINYLQLKINNLTAKYGIIEP